MRLWGLCWGILQSRNLIYPAMYTLWCKSLEKHPNFSSSSFTSASFSLRYNVNFSSPSQSCRSWAKEVKKCSIRRSRIRGAVAKAEMRWKVNKKYQTLRVRREPNWVGEGRTTLHQVKSEKDEKGYLFLQTKVACPVTSYGWRWGPGAINCFLGASLLCK